MTTNTAQVLPPTRQDQRQVSNTLKQTINWNDAGIASGIQFQNSLPMGAVITSVIVEVITAFDGGSSVLIGTNSPTFNNIVAAGDVDETVVGANTVARALGGSIARAADITPSYILAAGAPTVGQIQITITYEGGWLS